MAQKRTHDSQSDSGRDPLGEPLGHFGTGLRAMLYIGVAMIFGLCGGGIVGASGPLASVVLENPDGTIYTILGWVFVAIGMLLIAYGVFQSGRSFEVRRKGVRYRTRNSLTEMFWDEIDLIRVNKTTYIDQSGLRRKIQWEITITGMTDEISLSPSFLGWCRACFS